LVRNRISYHAAAAALGVKHPTVLQWVRGPNRPLDHRGDIEAWTRGEVPELAWRRKGERASAPVAPFEPTGTE
jgi:DNA-binding transcriptional regulator YdaS (Cro superfamily)